MSEDYYSIIEQSKLKECKNVRRLKKGMSIRMKICIINGSPKGGKSNSELLKVYNDYDNGVFKFKIYTLFTGCTFNKGGL